MSKKYFIPKDDFREIEIAPGVRIKTVAGEKIMFSFLEFQPHASIPPHSHPHEQMGFVLEGQFELNIGGERKLVKKGDVYLIPSNVEHSGFAGEEGATTLDVFSPPREDYL